MDMSMKVLVVGGGAREHAIADALNASEQKPEIYAVLGNRNPGIISLAHDHLIHKETDVDRVVAWAQEKGVQLAIIGPEAPLAAGLGDALAIAGVQVASPTKAAARIETDKAWMRQLMQRHDLKGQVSHQVHDNAEEARAAIEAMDARVALKPVGLTGGKGVQVHGDHFQDTEGAMKYVHEVLENRIGGEARIVIEEKMEGEEFTLQAFCDGHRLLPLPAVQDHKRLLPGDEGPNTGGMGAYSQSDHLLPFLTQNEYEEAFEILKGIVGALREEGHTYRGAIYGQFIVTPQGPRVIEINARYGDPEAMNVLALLEGDFLEICKAMAAGNLEGVRATFLEKSTVVKYVVPEGYGSAPRKGVPLHIDEQQLEESEARLYYAAVNQTDTGLETTTSRALAVLGIGETLSEANEICESGLKSITSDHIFVRHDIGTKELIQRRIEHMRTLRAT
jgi:phosphoribosylamine---glycine ligase